MYQIYENWLNRIRAFATEEGVEDFRRARDEFHRLTGLFEDEEAWFELRMGMFHDWFLLDRPGTGGLTPVERFIRDNQGELSQEELKQLEYFTVSLRSVFRIVRIKKDEVLLDDLAGGGQWLAAAMVPLGGLGKTDIIDTRILILNGKLVVGSGTVLHPQEANDMIERIVARARTEGMRPRELVDHLDKMRLKLDRYANVRVQHVYQYPGDAIL